MAANYNYRQLVGRQVKLVSTTEEFTPTSASNARSAQAPVTIA